MLELLKKGMYWGVGLFEESREKVEELVDDLVKRGEVTLEEKSKVVEKYVQKLKEQEQVLSTRINNEIKKAIEKLGVPTREEYNKLVQEIEDLKKRLDEKK
jgi:polyhydroxyalkanoate synthesis regulator phasin